jgi:TPR repeat protein
MRGTLFLILFVASSAAAQTPRKPACELVRVADVEAALGVSPLRAVDPATQLRSSLKPGQSCSFEKAPNQQVFSVYVEYADAPDADAVTKWLKMIETTSYDKARPALGLGDAAYYTELQGNPAAPKTLTVFVAGTMLLQLRHGTSDQQLRSLAEKALGTSGTRFAYNGVVPTSPKPALPPRNATSASPLDELKATLTRKADAGDVRAAEALANLYRFGSSGSSAVKPDFAAAMYWYKRASDHGVARASYHLATMYHEGIGGPVNDDAAQALFTRAADAGYVPAMVPLAFLYAAKPDFVSKRRAADWGLKAAAADDTEGHLLAGYLWDKGLLSFDDSESGRNALAEYRKAADRGNCIAMMNTGGLYFNGRHRLPQDAAQAQAWFDRAQACFGKGFQALRQKATRYRALAAAGHLPVPEVPPPPQNGSPFFNRGGQPLTVLQQAAGVLLAVTAMSAAYRIAHPELAAQPGPGQSSGGAVDYRDPRDDYSYNDMQDNLHYAQMQQQVWSGGCKPPVGCF